MSTEEQVQQAVNHLSSACDVEVQLRPCDQMEEELVAQFASTGCGCSKECSHQFPLDYIRDMRAQCYNLTHTELDMVILGQLAAGTNTSVKVVVESGHLERKRHKPYTTFHHAGKAVCGKTFRFLHIIGNKRLKNLAKNLRENGLTHAHTATHTNDPKTHCLLRQVSLWSGFSSAMQSKMDFSFLSKHLDTVIQISSSFPLPYQKKGIWKMYHSAAEEHVGIHPVAYTTFCCLWRTLLPSVTIMKPRTDLCWTCHQNSTAILCATNCSEASKSSTIKKALEHLRIVKVERNFYKSICDACRISVRAHFTQWRISTTISIIKHHSKLQ